MIDLGGDAWQLRGCLGREWEWHVGPDRSWDAPGWLPARVPGSVVDDLWRAGVVPDPYRGRNSLLLEWVPERAWIYRRRLPGDGGVLRFDGVDHACTVFVDGNEVGAHRGCFVPFEVEVPVGARLLAVVVHPAPASEPQVGRTSLVREHKPRMSYGWDFCPRMVHLGIWRRVTLGGGGDESSVSVTLEDGAGVVRAGGDEVRMESPELWWPNGMGPPRLHRLSVGGREVEVGFRTVELDDYALVVNGRRTPIKGWNWVPLDALYGVPRPEKLAHLLRLAAGAHVNLVRVWGGGLLETEEFYRLCDRLGLLVWQEFSMSSSGMESVPSDDPDFVERLAGEARSIVPRQRHHPSLAIWCGGNELAANDSTPAVAALREVVHELDPERAWLPTSPRGRDEHGPWEHQGLRRHYEHYDGRTALLHSEFGVEGMTNRRTLERLVDPQHRWPADRSNPVYEHLGAWWNNAPLVQEAFGGRIRDVATMRRASQHLQYDGLRYAVEATRRRGCGAIPWQLNESYPNAWCTAAVDHRGDPKPAYYGVRRAYDPVHACASFLTCAWGGEAEARARIWTFGSGETAFARLVDANGLLVAESSTGEISAPLEAFASDVFVLDLSLGGIPRNRYVMSRTETLAPLLDLAPAQVEVALESDHLELRHVGGPAALGIVVEDARPYGAPGWVVFGDNVVDLLPGESRTIEIEAPAAPKLLVEGWNLEALRVG